MTILSEQKIAHRDIKPGNIFLTLDGDFKLGDFGSAHSFTEQTHVAILSLTTAYCAYETKQAYYNGQVNARLNWTKADVCSVALVILDMIRLKAKPSLNNIDKVS